MAGIKGMKHTSEHNRKIALALKGRIVTAVWRQRISQSLTGRPRTTPIWCKGLQGDPRVVKSCEKARSCRKEARWNKGLTKENDVRVARQAELQKQVWNERGGTWNKNLTKYDDPRVARQGGKGERNPMWRGRGHRHGIYGENWDEIRKEVLVRDNWTCAICQRQLESKELDVHHITNLRLPQREQLDNRQDCLISLCNSCHGWVESCYVRKKFKESTVLLLSGGMDSTCAYYLLDKPPIMYFCIGHRYMKPEFISVCRLAKRENAKLKFIEIPWLGEFEQGDAWIPNRNGYMVSIAALYANKIYLVVQRGEMDEPDRSLSFFKEMSDYLTFAMKRTIMVDPVFPHLTKQDILKEFLSKGYPINLLEETYSCFSGKGWRCGQCACCIRLALALAWNDIDYHDWFEIDPFKTDTMKQYKEKFLKGEYEERRRTQGIEAIKKIDEKKI